MLHSVDLTVNKNILKASKHANKRFIWLIEQSISFFLSQNILYLACHLDRRLRKMQPQQPGYSSSRVYLELLADLPWQKVSDERELDLRAAKESLDHDHYGLIKVKQRIIEYLAVRKVSISLSVIIILSFENCFQCTSF
jgi:ATP-dependent Lon protease